MNSIADTIEMALTPFFEPALIDCSALRNGEKQSRLCVGLSYSIEITSSCPGYLNVFNIGTDNSISHIFPHGAQNHFICSGIKSIVSSVGGQTEWMEYGPRTEETSFKESILVIIVDKDIYLDSSDIHIDAKQSRGRMGNWTDGTCPIFNNPDKHSIHAAIFKFEVV